MSLSKVAGIVLSVKENILISSNSISPFVQNLNYYLCQNFF